MGWMSLENVVKQRLASTARFMCLVVETLWNVYCISFRVKFLHIARQTAGGLWYAWTNVSFSCTHVEFWNFKTSLQVERWGPLLCNFLIYSSYCNLKFWCNEFYDLVFLMHRSPVSWVSIETRLRDERLRVWFLAGDRNFSLHHRVPSSSGAHAASYPIGTGGKAAGAWSWPLTSI
jgi:hypothetical protein